MPVLSTGYRPLASCSAQRAGAQRLCALTQSGPSAALVPNGSEGFPRTGHSRKTIGRLRGRAATIAAIKSFPVALPATYYVPKNFVLQRSLGQARRHRPAGIIDLDPEWAALVGITGYMESFGPSFLGLSISSDEIEQAARSFKVKLESIQLSDDPHRPCDETHLTDFHDAAKRSASKAAACIERA
jgi:hypothetical protein